MDRNNFKILQYKTLIIHKKKISKLFFLIAISIIASCSPPNTIITGGSSSPFAVYMDADASSDKISNLTFEPTIINDSNIKHIYIRNESGKSIEKFIYELPFGFGDEDTFKNSNYDNNIISCTKKEYLDPNEICRISIRFQPSAKDTFKGKIKITVPEYSFESIELNGEGLNNTYLDIPDRKKLQLGFVETGAALNRSITLKHNKLSPEPISFKLITRGNKINTNNLISIEYLDKIEDDNRDSINRCNLNDDNDDDYDYDNYYRDDEILKGELTYGSSCILDFKITNANGEGEFAYSSIIIKQDSFIDVLHVTGIIVENNALTMYTPTIPNRRSSHMLSQHKDKLILIGGVDSNLDDLKDIWKYNGLSWDDVTQEYNNPPPSLSNTGSVFTDDTTYLIGGRIDDALANKVTSLSKNKDINTDISTGHFPIKYSFAYALLKNYVYILGGINELNESIDNDTLIKFDTSTKEFSNVEITNKADIDKAIMMAAINDYIYILSDNVTDSNSRLIKFHILDSSNNAYRDITTGDNITIPFVGEEISVKVPSRISELNFVVRDNASIITANNSIFVFGGKTPTGVTNEMYIYSLSDHQPILDIFTQQIVLTKCCSFAREELCVNTCSDESPKAYAWAQVDNTVAPFPEPRYNAKMQSIGDDIYLFGGIAADNKTMLNDLWKYETKNYQWVKLIDNNDLDSASNRTPPVLVDNNKVCTLDTENPNIKGVLFCYDTITNAFKFIEPKVPLDDDVSDGARLIYYDRNIYLFQASDSGKINVYNLDNNSWYEREIDPDTDSNIALYDNMTLAIDKNTVYSFEHYRSKRISYTYDLTGTGAITKRYILDDFPPPERTNGAMAVFDNHLYIQGGNRGDEKLSDTWRLNLAPLPQGNLRPWENLDDNYMMGKAPAYINHSLIELDNKLYLIGGEGNNKDDKDKVYVLDESPSSSEGMDIVGWKEVELKIPLDTINGENQFIKFEKNSAVGIKGNTLKIISIN